MLPRMPRRAMMPPADTLPPERRCCCYHDYATPIAATGYQVAAVFSLMLFTLLLSRRRYITTLLFTPRAVFHATPC